MSTDQIFCSQCGTASTPNERFCSKCGAKLVKEEPKPPKCHNCGADVDPSHIFCPECGTNLSVSESHISECPPPMQAGKENVSTGTNTKESSSDFARTPRKIIKRSLALLVSMLLLAFAFLPVCSFETSNYSDYYVERFDLKPTAKISAIDCIILSIDSMRNLDEEELSDTALYYERDELDEEFEALMDLYDPYEESTRLDKEDKKDAEKILSKMAYAQLRLDLQSDSIKFNASHLLTFLLSSIYILVTVAFFIISLIDFILLMCGKDKANLFSASSLLLSLAPMAAISMFVSIYMTNYISIISWNYPKYSISSTWLLSIIFPIALVIYYAIDRTVYRQDKIKASAIVKRTLSTTVALILLISVFIPTFNFEVKAIFDGSTKKETASVSYDMSHFAPFASLGSESEVGEYVDNANIDEVSSIINSGMSSISSGTKKEFIKNKDVTYLINMTVVFLSLFGYGGADLMPLFTAASAAMIAIAVIACVILWLNIYSIATGASPHSAITIPVRILGILLAAFTLVIVIVMMGICNYNLNNAIEEGARAGLTIGAGGILTLIMSIALMSIPMATKKRHK